GGRPPTPVTVSPPTETSNGKCSVSSIHRGPSVVRTGRSVVSESTSPMRTEPAVSARPYTASSATPTDQGDAGEQLAVHRHRRPSRYSSYPCTITSAAPGGVHGGK